MVTRFRIAVLHDQQRGERRVALTPAAVDKLATDGHNVVVETNAGLAAGSSDSDYSAAGARIAADRRSTIGEAGVVVSINAPLNTGEMPGLCSNHTMIAIFDPVWCAGAAAEFAATNATTVSLDLMPRITRAQSMDVLSSMATVSGYQAVLVAATNLPSLFPMLMTAAGTVPPARVVVLGAGVAGLQAIATARRLGAVVEGYDIRPAAAEQIASLGARVINLDVAKRATEDAGGYAVAQDADIQSRQQAALTSHLAAADVVITTAAIPGARSPELITAAMVEHMSPGSIIVDLAAERGGNCALTQPDVEVVHEGVRIFGPTDLASGAAATASQMFSHNMVNLIRHLPDMDGHPVIDLNDEIIGPMVVATGGEVVHPLVCDALTTELAG